MKSSMKMGRELDDVETSISTLAPAVPRIEPREIKWKLGCTFVTPVDAPKIVLLFPLPPFRARTSEDIWPTGPKRGSIRRYINDTREERQTFNARFLIPRHSMLR